MGTHSRIEATTTNTQTVTRQTKQAFVHQTKKAGKAGNNQTNQEIFTARLETFYTAKRETREVWHATTRTEEKKGQNKLYTSLFCVVAHLATTAVVLGGSSVTVYVHCRAIRVRTRAWRTAACHALPPHRHPCHGHRRYRHRLCHRCLAAAPMHHE